MVEVMRCTWDLHCFHPSWDPAHKCFCARYDCVQAADLAVPFPCGFHRYRRTGTLTLKCGGRCIFRTAAGSSTTCRFSISFSILFSPSLSIIRAKLLHALASLQFTSSVGIHSTFAFLAAAKFSGDGGELSRIGGRIPNGHSPT